MYQLSEIQKIFLNQARKQKRKIAVGIARPEEEVMDSVWQAAGYADLTIVGSKIDGLNSIPTKDDDEASQVIVDLVKNKKVDGFVRAQLKDSYTHSIFIKEVGGDPEAKFVPLIIAKDDYWAVISNPSNYSSLDAKHQQQEALRCARYMKEDLKIEPKIGVMSTRRPTGKVGKYALVEQIAQNSESTVEVLKKEGYDVKEYYIEYERAVWEKRNLLVASLGMIANTWLKGLCYLGGWKIIHTAYLDKNAYYDDSPRNNKNWFWPIISTVAWINRDNNKLNRLVSKK